MLEKNEKKICDSHFHYSDCRKNSCGLEISWKACSCAHTVDEWKNQLEAPQNVLKSFGLHPQQAADSAYDYKNNAYFLEGLLKNNRQNKILHAIGESGFDFFTDSYKACAIRQEELWNVQLELAKQFNMPFVVHCRKANEKLFEYKKELKKLPSILFHSFMGSSIEAKSLLSCGINGFFSFGKQMMNGNKKVIDCVKNLPLNVLLFETDAPFQTLRGEQFTNPVEIEKVYLTALLIRQVAEEKKNDFYDEIKQNFDRLFLCFN